MLALLATRPGSSPERGSPERRSPEADDLIWVDFDLVRGHEQGRHRPALVLNPGVYNARTGLCIACPLTSQAKGYPFEVAIPPGHAVTGVVLVDQVRSLSWTARNAEVKGKAPAEIMEEVRAKLAVLVGID